MAKSVIQVRILGDNKGLTNSLSDSANKIGKFSKVAVLGLAAVGVAAGAAAIKGITAFADFEKSMNEVFTLLPDISQEAMDAMSDQVKDFSKEFGVLPEETVPALYQALSAGVPEDNVFEFLETAQKAAKGGVTDLTTAVDGISSVVNAYGEDVIGATEASDLMFTAVRLGKTNFEELSASLSNVTPIASSLGVGFDEVAASLAVLTAKGVPTAQATTQVKGALAELGKEGTIADKAFRELSGVGFQAFVEGGGSMQEAFAMIADGADASGGSVLDMFGSVEAGQAVLALTAGDSEAFIAAIDEMESSAGATEAAFETMDGGLASSFEKIKANFAVILIEIGEKLAPTVQAAADWIADNADNISAAFDKAMEILGDAVDIAVGAVSTLVDFFVDNWPTIQDVIEDVFDWLVDEAWPTVEPVFEAIVDGAEAVIDFFVDNWPKALDAIQATWDWIKDNKDVVIGAISALGVVAVGMFLAWAAAAAAAAVATIAAAAPFIAIGVAVAAVGAAMVWAYQNIEVFRTVVDAVVSWLVNDAWPLIQTVAAGIVTAFQAVVDFFVAIWPTVQQILETSWAVITALFETAVATIKVIWETWGETLISFIQGVWDAISALIGATLDVIKGIVKTVTSLIKGDWEGVWDGIKQIVVGVWDSIKAVVGLAINSVKTTIQTVIDGIKLGWETMWGGVSTFVSDIWGDITGFVSGGIDTMMGFVTGLPGRILSAVSGMWDGIWSGFKGIINRIIDAWNNLKLPGFTIGGQGIGPIQIPTLTVPSLDPFPHIPRLADGAIIRRPTLALLGDNRSGVEAVVPLERADEFGFGQSKPNQATVIINLMDRYQVEAIVSERDADLLASLEAGLR